MFVGPRFRKLALGISVSWKRASGVENSRIATFFVYIVDHGCAVYASATVTVLASDVFPSTRRVTITEAMTQAALFEDPRARHVYLPIVGRAIQR